MRCPFVAVRPNARFIVLPHWDNMSQAHMLTHPVTLGHSKKKFCFRSSGCPLLKPVGRPHFFFGGGGGVVGKYCPLLGKNNFFFAKMKKKSPFAPFLTTRPLHRKQKFFLVWPYTDTGLTSHVSCVDGEFTESGQSETYLRLVTIWSGQSQRSQSIHLCIYAIEAVHKNNYVSGKAAGRLKKGATGDFFLYFFCIFFFTPKMDNIFLPKNKKWGKINAAAQLALILATRWTGNRLFFYAQPDRMTVRPLCRLSQIKISKVNIMWIVLLGHKIQSGFYQNTLCKPNVDCPDFGCIKNVKDSHGKFRLFFLLPSFHFLGNLQSNDRGRKGERRDLHQEQRSDCQMEI